MANYTQGLILDTFESMLEHMPFDKITVTALIKQCNIGRNTFYYHYADIYALLDEWLHIKVGELTSTQDSARWQDLLKNALYTCRDNKRKIYNVYTSLSRDRLENYLFGQADGLIADFVVAAGEKKGAQPERVKTIASIMEYTVFGFFLRFLHDGMKGDIETSVDNLGSVLDEILEKLL